MRCLNEVYLVLTFFLLLAGSANSQSQLPLELKKLFFETSTFSKPILLEIPSESSLSQFQTISQTPHIYESGLPTATIIIGKNKDLEDFNKSLLSFLVQNGYAKIKTKIQITHGSYGTTSKTYNFIFYSDDFKNKIQYYNVNELGESKTKPFIKLAHRKIISIDFKNQYEDTPMGMKRTFYSVIFSYGFVNDLPNLPIISDVFKGKGKAFQDPDDGTWKMDGNFENLGIKLDDNGSDRFLSLFGITFDPFIFKVQTGYDGEYKEGKKYGHGIMIYENGDSYEGEWKDDKKNGQGKMVYDKGASYKGEWKDDKKNGRGKMIYKDGSSFEGEWKGDEYGSHGIIIWANGINYSGELLNGNMNGKGRLFKPDGNDYIGDFVNGHFEGEGVLTQKSDDGTIYTFKGFFKAGELLNGNKVKVLSNGKKYITECKNGEMGEELEQK